MQSSVIRLPAPGCDAPRLDQFSVHCRYADSAATSPIKVGGVDSRTGRPIYDANRFVTIQGLWDTGATRSLITQRVVDELRINPHGVGNVVGITSEVQHWPVVRLVVALRGRADGGDMQVRYYLINHVNVSRQRAPDQDWDMLLGMDVIGLGDLQFFEDTDGKRRFVWIDPPKPRPLRLS